MCMTATEEQQQAARDRLTELGSAYTTAEKQLEAAREALNEGIADILMTRTLGPSEVTRLVPYERQHVGRIAKAAGVPPLREATVVSRAKASAPREPSATVATPRPRVAQAPPKPEPIDLTGISPEVAALPLERVRSLAASAESRQPQWVAEIREEYPDANELRLCYLIVDTGFRQGRKPPELADQSGPEKEQTA
jgi:hypothetical protein